MFRLPRVPGQRLFRVPLSERTSPLLRKLPVLSSLASAVSVLKAQVEQQGKVQSSIRRQLSVLSSRARPRKKSSRHKHFLPVSCLLLFLSSPRLFLRLSVPHMSCSSQASPDPSAHGRVRSSLIHRLVHPATIVAAQSECRNGMT